MKPNYRTRKLLSVLVFFLYLTLQGTLLSAQESEQIRYQGVTIQPGDVITFHGGGATTGHLLVYGHASLFLGIDPQTGKRTFLDFSTTKGGATQIVFGTSRPFNGRILGEQEFLSYNGKYHQSFDVFQLQNRSNLDQREMLREAKRLSATEKYGVYGEVCSSTVAAVLSKATGTKIDVFSPDGFGQDAHFHKNPQLAGKTINIQAALREVGSGSDPIIGRWSGQAYQPVGGSRQYYPMNMQIDSPSHGRTDYPSLSCGGALSGGPSGGGSYSYQESITYGGITAEKSGCIDGHITVTVVDHDNISISWSGSYQGQSITVSGTLKRQ